DQLRRVRRAGHRRRRRHPRRSDRGARLHLEVRGTHRHREVVHAQRRDDRRRPDGEVLKMEDGYAAELIAAAVPGGVATWGDIGAGTGTFTRALARTLSPGSTIFAVDREPASLAHVLSAPVPGGIHVVPILAD